MPSDSKKVYARIVFDLPIEGPFDYLVSLEDHNHITPGMRAMVYFGRRKAIGFIVSKTFSTNIKHLKPILQLIDSVPILDSRMLKLTKHFSEYYACSWGEAIAATLPTSLRKGKVLALSQEDTTESALYHKMDDGNKDYVLQDPHLENRWDIYLRLIKENIAHNRTVIFLLPDRNQAESVYQKLRILLQVNIGLFHSYLSATEELAAWIAAKNGSVKVVVGTRMAIFAPLLNVGLIIIEEEYSSVYKQETVPHYNAVGVARMRSNLEKAKVVFSCRYVSVEIWHQVKRRKAEYLIRNEHLQPDNIKLIDLQRAGFMPQSKRMNLSIALEDVLTKTVHDNAKILLFFNRRGFAVFAYCYNCQTVLRCLRCDTNLTLHFKENKLMCHRCNYTSSVVHVCPYCHSGYIRYVGFGTEKLESELSRLYPNINIAHLDKETKGDVHSAQLVIATESLFKYAAVCFDLVGVISVDAALNRPDFRAAEKVFLLLLHLSSLAQKTLSIQTYFPHHYSFKALIQKQLALFYETELRYRKQSHLPPFKHLIFIKLRGKHEERVKSASSSLFSILVRSCPDKSIHIESFSAQIPYKLRDQFHEQIVVKTHFVKRAVIFLKKILGEFRHSGIIITIDVDPV